MPLEEKLQQLEKSVNKMDGRFVSFRAEVRKEFEHLKVKLAGWDAVEHYKASHPAKDTLGIPTEAWAVVKWLVLIIAAILGVRLV